MQDRVALDAELVTAAAGLHAQLPAWVHALNQAYADQLEQAAATGEADLLALLESHAPEIDEGALVCAGCRDEQFERLVEDPEAAVCDEQALLFPCAVLQQRMDWSHTGEHRA